MARFLKESDFEMQVRNEIIRLLTEQVGWFNSAKLVRAEQTAIQQIRHRIGSRYDCDQIFSPAGETDERDQWIVTMTIDMALYHLHSQTQAKDISKHRQDRYQDALDWLKDISSGVATAMLPSKTDESGTEYGEVRIFSRAPEEHKW